MSQRFSRRNILSGLAAAPVLSALSPFLPVGMARAADASAPKRLLTIFHPMGWLESTFWPTPDGTSFKLDPVMAPLEPWKSKLIFPDGLLLRAPGGNEHGRGMSSVFTGSGFSPGGPELATGASYDYLIAEHLYAQFKTPHKYLPLGVNAVNNNFGGDHCFYSAPGRYFIKDNEAASVFDTVFSRLQTTGMVDDGALARVKAQKKSVIDLVKADLDRICRKVGAQEKIKCEAHLDSIRAMEMNLANIAAPTTCSKPARPASGDELSQKMAAQFDMIAAAFACDQTRVISLTMGQCNGGLDLVPGVNQHDTTHKLGDAPNEPSHVENHKRIDNYLATGYAQLFKKLDAYKEGNGSLLDNTLIVMASDTTSGMGLVNVRGAHRHSRMTYLVAGGGNFAFRTGRHLKIANPSDKTRSTHHRLLVSVSRAFGLNVDKIGDYDPSSGPLAELA